MAIERPAQPVVIPRVGSGGILCPYCGCISTGDPRKCARCGGFFDPLSRQATQNAMGPWFIHDTANPFRPGCSFETLRDLARRGKVTRDTVLRGPSTRQYWNFAARTPGIANLLGVCHNCHVDVEPDDYSCAACGAVFTPETDRQHLGLAPVHLLPGQAAPEIIAAAAVDQARRPAVKRKPGASMSLPAAEGQAPGRAPKPSRGGPIGLIVLLLLGLALVAGIGFVVVRVLLPALEPAGGRPGTVAPPATAPSARVQTPSQPTPEPSKPPEEAPPSQPDPSPDPSAGPGVADILKALDADDFDAAALLAKVDQLPPGTPDAASLRDLIRARDAQRRLRTLPR